MANLSAATITVGKRPTNPIPATVCSLEADVFRFPDSPDEVVHERLIAVVV